MMLISSIIEAVIVFVLMVIVAHLFDDIDDEQVTPTVGEEYVIPGVMGAVTGAINYFSQLLQEGSLIWAPIMFACMVAVVLYLAYYWHQKGSEWKELIPFVLVLIPISLTMRQTAWATSSIVQSDFLASVVCTLPGIISILAVGFLVFDLFYFRYAEVDRFDTETAEEARNSLFAQGRHRALMIVTTVVTALALCLCCVEGLEFNKATTNVNGELDTSVLDGVYAASGDDVGSVILDTWDGIHFYHNDVLNDGKDKNDWNNGPKGEGKDELIQRLGKDPALLAQLMLAYDYTVNTNFVGEVIYADYNDKWTVLDQVDAATRIMASKKSVFDAGNNAIVKMINGASSVKREKRKVSDQVFMHSNTIDGIPSTVVFESNVKEAMCLVLTYNFKDDSPAAEIVLREACGYQWCNGANDIGVTPKAYPSSGTSSPSGKGGGKKSHDKTTHPSKKPSGTGDKPSGPSYNKDPNKAPSKDTEPNDDKGPGPNTNNPSNPNRSTEDKDTNSNNGMTYDQYKEKIQQNKDANKPSSGGGSSSGGSSSGGSSSGGSSHKDDNSSGGTGHGGIDKPTPSSKPATSGGKPVTDSGAGDSWEGPSD